MDEVRAALKEMKKHKAPGLSGLNRNDRSHRGYSNPVDIRLM